MFNTNLAASSQTGHTIYDPTKSTAAATVSGATFDISYGDGSFANGPVGTDQVDIGGATVQAQTIGLPNNVSTSFVDDTASNGLLGLAFSSLNTVQPNQAKTFFDNAAGNLSQQVFTANLRSNSTGCKSLPSQIVPCFISDLQRSIRIRFYRHYTIPGLLKSGHS